MKLLLYGLNYKPELTGVGKYSGEMAAALNKKGFDVQVVTAPPYYPEWALHSGHKNAWATFSDDGVKVHRCPLYVPHKVSTFKRLVHLASFAASSALRLITLIRGRPDVVFMVEPTLFCAPAALIYGKITGAKTIIHIQDYEVDAMLGLGLVGTGSGRLSRLLAGVEGWFMRRFDRVSTISVSMQERAVKKGVDPNKVLFFPNWSDTEFVTPSINGDPLRERWGFGPQDKIVLYSGNIGQKQGLEVVLEAAKAFQSELEVKFVVVGSGAYSKELERMSMNLGLSNIYFKPLQPWEDVPAMLAMADIHLIIQKKGAADAVLPSKLTNVLSAGGHALVTADVDTELGKIARQYPGIYTCVKPEDTDAFISGLRNCLEACSDEYNKVARHYAVENLNLDKVIDRFICDLKRLAEMD